MNTVPGLRRLERREARRALLGEPPYSGIVRAAA